MLSLWADSPWAQSCAAPWPGQADVLQWPWSPFRAPKLQTVSVTQAGRVAQADGNAVAFLGCSSGSFQAGTNCVGGAEVSEKGSWGEASVTARGVSFQARFPGQTFQNPFPPTASLHTPFRGSQWGCNGPTASQNIQHGCRSQPAPLSAHPAHTHMQEPCQGLWGALAFGVLGVSPQRG